MKKSPRIYTSKLHKFESCGHPRSFYRMNFQLTTASLLLVATLASVNAANWAHNPYSSAGLNPSIFPSSPRRSTSFNSGEFSEDGFNQRYQETQNRIDEARERINRSSQDINRSITQVEEERRRTANSDRPSIDLSSLYVSGAVTGTPFSNGRNSRSDLSNESNPFGDSFDEEQERRRLTELFASTEGMVDRGMCNAIGASLGPGTNRNRRNLNSNEANPLDNNSRFGGDIEESDLNDLDLPTLNTFNLRTQSTGNNNTSRWPSNNNDFNNANYKIPKHAPWILTILAVFTVVSVIVSIVYAQKGNTLNQI